ncbi:MAG: OmpA family protein [Candidatus Brocadiia bacterium]
MRNRILLLVLAVAFLGLTGCANQAKELREQKANLQEQLRMCEGERESLLANIDELQAEKQTLQQQLAEAQQEAGQQEELLSQLRAEQARLEEQRAELQSLVKDLSGVEVQSRREGNFIVVENDILFALGKIDLTEEAKGALQEVLQYLLSHPSTKIRIDGHTDGVPIRNAPFEDNYHLSAMRAHSVMTYLVENGMDPARGYICGFGPNRPVVEPEEPTAPVAENRRVEILVMPEGSRSISEILEGFEE